MAPTPLALELADPVCAVLEGVETLFTESDGFQPDQSDRVFTIGLSDYAAFVFLPGLAARIERAAPNVQLVIRNTSHVLGLPMIEADEVELIVGNFPIRRGTCQRSFCSMRTSSAPCARAIRRRMPVSPLRPIANSVI